MVITLPRPHGQAATPASCTPACTQPCVLAASQVCSQLPDLAVNQWAAQQETPASMHAAMRPSGLYNQH